MREIVWVKQARKEFEAFPSGARDILLSAIVIAAEGGKADIAKPMKGLGAGVMEIALAWRSDAYRVVYAVQLMMPCGSSTHSRRSQTRALRRRPGK